MGSPSVRQLQYLNEVFRETLEEFSLESLAVLGCATGKPFYVGWYVRSDH